MAIGKDGFDWGPTCSVLGCRLPGDPDYPSGLSKPWCTLHGQHYLERDQREREFMVKVRAAHEAAGLATDLL